MSASALPAPPDQSAFPALLNARRLIQVRMIAVPGLALCLLLARYPGGLQRPALSLSVIVLGLVVFNLWAWRRFARRSSISDSEFFLQIIVDLVALTGTLYYTGGASNPFAFFFVLPMTITAVSLPRGYTWAMAALSSLAYTFLLLYHAENTGFAGLAGEDFVHLHGVGMWIGFVVTAGLIAHFVTAMAETVRQRDRYLAEMRESALRDERVVALATLAAGAAHELSTPLATMAVLGGEIAADHPATRYPELHRKLQILTAQIARCKEALSAMSASAGVARADAVERFPLDVLVNGVVREVCRLRPGANVQARIMQPLPAPLIVVDRTVRQALLNVVHNAIDVSPEHVAVTCSWDNQAVKIAVIDHGTGMDPAGANGAHRLGASTKPGGLGVGLFLAHAAIEHLGGRLTTTGNEHGGTTVTLQLPLDRLTEAQT